MDTSYQPTPDVIAAILLAERLVFGALFAAHGTQKLFGWFRGGGLEGTGSFFEKLGFHPGRAFAAAAGLTELTAGLLIALGFLGPVGPALLLSVMVVAVITVQWGNGLLATSNGSELPILYVTVAVILAFAGFGPYSLDAGLGIPSWPTRLIGAVLAAGILGGLSNALVGRRRAPSHARHWAVRRDRKTSIDNMARHLCRCALAVAICVSIAELGHAQAARTTRDDRTPLHPSERMSELDIVGLPLDTSLRELMTHATVEAPVKGELESLVRATGWLNSRPLAAADLRGKVVLVDFWTYSCINWIRQLPYVRAWAEKYKDQGLVVIGVHTPEFGFEHDIDNVRRATKDMRVEYAVATDNDYAIWGAFRNAYWPALYLVDAKGKVRYHHFGEGEYEKSERMIQKLLAEAGARNVSRELLSVDARGAEAPADWESLRSPETYLGYERTQNFASPGGPVSDARHVYRVPARMRLNQWALFGDWTFGRQATKLNTANGRIVHRFHARDLHLVMGPAARGTSLRFRVLIDGQPPGTAHGVDVDAQGNGTVTEQRMYQLIRQPKPIGDRQFEIEFLDPGVEVFSFTFG